MPRDWQTRVIQPTCNTWRPTNREWFLCNVRSATALSRVRYNNVRLLIIYARISPRGIFNKTRSRGSVFRTTYFVRIYPIRSAYCFWPGDQRSFRRLKKNCRRFTFLQVAASVFRVAVSNKNYEFQFTV